jgi:hypothetical protein
MNWARLATATALSAVALTAGCSGSDEAPAVTRQPTEATHSIAPRTDPPAGSDMARLGASTKGAFLAAQELALVEAVAGGIVFDHWDQEKSVIELDALRDELEDRLAPSAGYSDARFVLDDVTVTEVAVTPDPQTAPDGVNMDMTLEHSEGTKLVTSAGKARYKPDLQVGRGAPDNKTMPLAALHAWAAFRAFTDTEAGVSSPDALAVVNDELEAASIEATVSEVSGTSLSDVTFTLTSAKTGTPPFAFDAAQLDADFVQHASKLWLPTFD